MTEDVTHHLPKLLLSIPVFPLELFHRLFNRLLALSLRPRGRSQFYKHTYPATRAETTLKYCSMLAGAWQQQEQEWHVNKSYKKNLASEDSETRKPDLYSVGSPRSSALIPH